MYQPQQLRCRATRLYGEYIAQAVPACAWPLDASGDAPWASLRVVTCSTDRWIVAALLRLRTRVRILHNRCTGFKAAQVAGLKTQQAQPAYDLTGKLGETASCSAPAELRKAHK